MIDSNEENNDSLELPAPSKHQNEKSLDNMENNKCNEYGPTHELEAQINIKHNRTVETIDFNETNTLNDSLHQTNTNGITLNIIENENKCIDLPGNYLTACMCELHSNHF